MSNQSAKGLKRLTDASWACWNDKKTSWFSDLFTKTTFTVLKRNACFLTLSQCRYVKKVGKRYLFWLGPQGRTSLCNVHAHIFIECPHPPPGYSVNSWILSVEALLSVSSMYMYFNGMGTFQCKLTSMYGHVYKVNSFQSSPQFFSKNIDGLLVLYAVHLHCTVVTSFGAFDCQGKKKRIQY